MSELVLYFIAFVLLLLAGFGVGYRRAAFGWLGLALAVTCAGQT